MTRGMAMIGAAALTLGLSACGGTSRSSSAPVSASQGSTGPLPSANPPAAQGASWSDYIVARPGRSCLTRGPVPDTLLRQTVASVNHKADGVHVVMHVQITPHASSAAPGPVQTLDLPYVLASNGTLDVAPTAVSPGQGVSVTESGSEVYPSVADLRAGRALNSAVTETISSTDPFIRSQIKRVLLPGQSALRGIVRFRMSAAPANVAISTPAGVFRDFVGVHLVGLSARSLNARRGQAAGFDQGFRATAASQSADLYFARGVGQVESIIGGQRGDLVRCTG